MNLELSVKLSELPDYPAFDFRVALADGPCGGYHSNEVSIVKPGNVATNYGYTWSEEPTIVGSTISYQLSNIVRYTYENVTATGIESLSPLYTLPTEINTFDLQQTGNTSMQYEVRVRAQ